MNEIVTKARHVDELAAEVAGASREQTQGITQINAAVGQMDKVTQGNAASAEESAAAAAELNHQAADLQATVTELLRLIGAGRRGPTPGPAATGPTGAHRNNPAASARLNMAPGPLFGRAAGRPADLRRKGPAHNEPAADLAAGRRMKSP